MAQASRRRVLENVGHDYVGLDITRLRYLGGSTNHWNGLCAPLAPIDFRGRDWVPYSGWPITKSDLDPFYRRAQPICQLGPYAYGERVWAELELRPHGFDARRGRTLLLAAQSADPIRRGLPERAGAGG